MFVAPATKVRIEYPQYNKSFADGDTVYEISLDDAGRIVQITSSSGEPFVVEYNTGDGESLFVNGQLQKVLSQNAFDDTCKFEAREAGAFWLESAPIGQAIAPTQYEFSNGILMVSGGELQLEYCADDFGYGVLVSHRSFFDKSKQLSWYDTFPWEERITIKGGQIRSGETATDKLNFAIIREYCHELSQVLLPLVFSDNPAYFHFLGFGASSYLTEGEVLYEPQNLSSRHGLPWAPAGGNGVGEHVNIRTDIRSNLYLMFYNGYQSIEKPYLYEQNSRVKRIRISCKNTGLFCDYEISDTAEGQMIDISPLYDI